MTVLGRSLAQSQVTVGTYEYLIESLAVQFHGEGEGDLVERVVGFGGFAQELACFGNILASRGPLRGSKRAFLRGRRWILFPWA